MEYPKPIMTISELQEMGYPREYLLRACHSKHAGKLCIRTSRRGKFLIKTEVFEYLQNRGCLR